MIIHRLYHFAFGSLPIRISMEGDPEQTWSEWFQEGVERYVVKPLRAFHEPLDAWLGNLPMWVAMACAIGLYVVAVIWVWGLRREFVFRGATDNRWWRDLRIWATIVVIPYVAVYLVLGR